MSKINTIADGLWSDSAIWSSSTKPGASAGAQIRHRVVIPAFTSTSVASSIAYTASGTYQGELIAQGPKSFVTVGSVKHRLGTESYVERTTSTVNTPIGTTA